jgi:two-component system, NarL family, sensor histidine kinase UhpB
MPGRAIGPNGAGTNGSAARLVIPDAIPVSRQTSEVAFRVAQEALRNVISHSKATGVELLVSLEGDWLVLTVTDDGIGFDVRLEVPQR